MNIHIIMKWYSYHYFHGTFNLNCEKYIYKDSFGILRLLYKGIGQLLALYIWKPFFHVCQKLNIQRRSILQSYRTRRDVGAKKILKRRRLFCTKIIGCRVFRVHKHLGRFRNFQTWNTTSFFLSHAFTTKLSTKGFCYCMRTVDLWTKLSSHI